ncbi:MAG: hypothetical protein AN485_23640, partial [Anabaena sp. MDT14b]
IPGILNVLPDCMSRMYAAPQRDIAGVAASVRVLSRGSLPRLPAHSTGLPLEAWHEHWDGGVTVCMMPDWFHGVLPSLGGGGSVTRDPSLVDVDLGYHFGSPLGHSNAHTHPAVAAVTRAAAASGRVDSGAGPVLDPLGTELHLPFALAKLGDGATVTPVDQRAEALKWAHAQGHRGTRGTYHRLLSEGYRWPNMEADCLKVA